MKKLIICIVGRTGSGKSAVAKEIAKRHGMTVVQSYTTRQPRPSEISSGLDKSDHLFVSEEEFSRMDMIAQTEISGARYGVTKELLMQNDIYIIDPNGIKDLEENTGDDIWFSVFYIYADEWIRKDRYIKRGGTKESFADREKSETEQFGRCEQDHCYDIIIYNNGKLSEAVDIMDGYVSCLLDAFARDAKKEQEEQSSKQDPSKGQEIMEGQEQKNNSNPGCQEDDESQDAQTMVCSKVPEDTKEENPGTWDAQNTLTDQEDEKENELIVYIA